MWRVAASTFCIVPASCMLTAIQNLIFWGCWVLPSSLGSMLVQIVSFMVGRSLFPSWVCAQCGGQWTASPASNLEMTSGNYLYVQIPSMSHGTKLKFHSNLLDPPFRRPCQVHCPSILSSGGFGTCGNRSCRSTKALGSKEIWDNAEVQLKVPRRHECRAEARLRRVHEAET